jgi:hypothetical protein
MADVVLTRQRIESGKTEQLREWMTEIRQREDEARETLENEGMVAEAAFLEQTEDEDFLVYYMEAEDVEHVYEAFSDSSHDIDEEHKAVMNDVLEDSANVDGFELLYHLRNPERP